jgi:hypothetical protein
MKLISKAEEFSKFFNLTRRALPFQLIAPEAREHLANLERQYNMIVADIDELFTASHIQDHHSPLLSVRNKMLKICLLANDLKMFIRKRAIRAFLESDRLIQAVGGLGE